MKMLKIVFIETTTMYKCITTAVYIISVNVIVLYKKSPNNNIQLLLTIKTFSDRCIIMCFDSDQNPIARKTNM